MSMRWKAVLLCFLAGCVPVVRGTVINGSGVTKTEDRPISQVRTVACSAVGTIKLRQGSAESLKITADDNIVPQLTSIVSGGRLTLGVKDNISLRTKLPIVYEITLQNLDGVEISGSANVDAEEISTPQFRCSISGSGAVKATGTAAAQTIEISGSGNFDGKNLAGDSATVAIAGSGNVSVAVQKTLTVKLSGSGSVDYAGTPEVTQTITGSGRVRKR